MTFPNFPDKHENSSLLNPQDIVEYRRKLGRLPLPNFPEGLLFCLERGLPRRLRRRIPVRKAGSMLGDLYLVRNPRDQVAVMTDFGGGSPIVAELAEEFVVMGARKLILMTWGGALQPDLRPGDIVVCDRAIRDEGTSHHYLPPEKYVCAGAELVAILVNALEARGALYTVGTTWTTDAPYRETKDEIQQYQSEGVKTVEMETAALLAIGQVRRVQAATLCVVADSLAEKAWKAPPDMRLVERGMETVYDTAIQVLAS